jgi:hypothetical protein
MWNSRPDRQSRWSHSCSANAAQPEAAEALIERYRAADLDAVLAR